MSDFCVTLILKTLFRRAQHIALTEVNSLVLSISQALPLNIPAQTPDFMDGVKIEEYFKYFSAGKFIRTVLFQQSPEIFP